LFSNAPSAERQVGGRGWPPCNDESWCSDWRRAIAEDRAAGMRDASIQQIHQHLAFFCPSRSRERSKGRCRSRMCGREVTLRQDAASASLSRRCYSFRSARARNFLFVSSAPCLGRWSGSLRLGALPPPSFLCPSASPPYPPPAAAAWVRCLGSSNSGCQLLPARAPLLCFILRLRRLLGCASEAVILAVSCSRRTLQ